MATAALLHARRLVPTRAGACADCRHVDDTPRPQHLPRDLVRSFRACRVRRRECAPSSTQNHRLRRPSARASRRGASFARQGPSACPATGRVVGNERHGLAASFMYGSVGRGTGHSSSNEMDTTRPCSRSVTVAPSAPPSAPSFAHRARTSLTRACGQRRRAHSRYTLARALQGMGT